MIHDEIDSKRGEADISQNTSPVATMRIVDRLDHRLVIALTILGFGLPLAVYACVIAHFSANVIALDQWSDVRVITKTWTHPFDWSAYWVPHNENRMFFPNIVAVVLAHTVHFNIQVEEWLSAAMLVVATALFLWSHKRRSRSTPWLYYCPVAFLAFSLVQYEDTLWGFQLAWYLIFLSLAVAVMLLDRTKLGWIAFVGAVGAAVVGSYSSVQGLLIWPVGLILLYHRRRPLAIYLAWVTAATATFVLYYHHFENKAGGRFPHFSYYHPELALKFYLFLVGDVLGSVQTARHHPGDATVTAFGAVLVILAVAILLVFGIRRDEHGGGPIGVVLICFGLLFALLVTQGRAFDGYVGASASRYTLFDLLIPMGIYLTLLGRLPAKASVDSASQIPPPDRDPSAQIGARARVLAWIDHTGVKWAMATVVVVIVVQVAIGTPNGLSGAGTRRVDEIARVRALTNPHGISNADVKDVDPFVRVSFGRRLIKDAKKYHLSLFGEGQPGISVPGDRALVLPHDLSHIKGPHLQTISFTLRVHDQQAHPRR